MSVIGQDHPSITALLGPTNTGKTHQALERMLEHPSGMIGLPLRLLAREVYDKLTARLGERSVALVTGEEKRVPAHPRYWVCTVEAMPMDLDVDFIAIDEIQLSAHPERGHVFTDRLLYARGRRETWFLGSETIRSLVERLVPQAKVRRHPRLSQLRAVPPVGLNSLPKRSAVVAFSASRVYELGERIRRKHGGAALVLGALSPRTRNAQVALYQSGEVDYLVATDAIGMGLNLDISHVIFADLSKFDGRESRPLELAELAQIAGRAGRYLNDGSFSVLAPTPAFSPKITSALERHHFPSETRLFYRNHETDFSSLDGLLHSLSIPPFRAELRSIKPAEDHQALLALSQKPEIRRLARSTERVSLLWEVCQIPDYRQLLFELHVRLLEDIFLQLTGPSEKLKPQWVDEQVARIERPSSDIETLMGQIASIRTWNYISQRHHWLDNGPALAHRAREIEDRLSDALHQSLLSRFVERRRTFANSDSPLPRMEQYRGHPFAQLLVQQQGSSSSPKETASNEIERLVESEHEAFRLDLRGRILYEERPIAALTKGVDLRRPEVVVKLTPDPGKGAVFRIQRRLLAFARDTVEKLLVPLQVRSIEQLTPPARGLIYQLEQGLGCVHCEQCREQLDALLPRDRQILQSLGVRFGTRFIFVRKLLTPEALRVRAALAAAFFGAIDIPSEDLVSRPILACPERLEHPAMSSAMGFVLRRSRLVRVDVDERLSSELSACARNGEFKIPRDLAKRLDCDESILPSIVEALGFVRRANGKFASIANRRHPSKRSGKSAALHGSLRDRNHHYCPTDNASDV